MKVNLNIKAQKSVISGAFPVVPAILALVAVVSVFWLFSLNGSRNEMLAKIVLLESRTAEAKKAISAPKIPAGKAPQGKLSIAKANLEAIQRKIQQAKGYGGQKTSLFGFFHGLETAVRGSSFMTRITSNPETGEFQAEGFSLSADSITEVIKNLQAQPGFSSVSLKEILGDEISRQKSLKFIMAFKYSDGGILDFVVDPAAGHR